MRDEEKGPEGDKESVPPFFFHKIYFFLISSQSNSRRTPTFFRTWLRKLLFLLYPCHKCFKTFVFF